MIKTFISTFLLAFACSIAFSQTQQVTDSMKQRLSVAKDDTTRVNIMVNISSEYRLFNLDSAVAYGEQAYTLANHLHFHKGEIWALGFESSALRAKGNLPMSLELGLKALQIAEENHFENETMPALNNIGIIYQTLKDYDKALYYFRRMLAIAATSHVPSHGLAYATLSIGQTFNEMDRLDSARYYLTLADADFRKINSTDELTYVTLGEVEMKSGNNAAALDYYQKSIQQSISNNVTRSTSVAYNKLALLYSKLNKPDSAIYYAKKGLYIAEQLSQKATIMESANLLSQLYETKDANESLRYYKIATAAKDSLYGAGSLQALQTIAGQAEEREKEMAAAKIAYQNRLKQYSFFAGFGIMILIAFILYRNNKQKQKANKVLENTLADLEATQVQLEEKNLDLEIEGALERVRTAAMAMKERADMLDICRIISGQLTALNVKEIRNVQTAIIYETKGVYTNYEFYAKHNKSLITEIDYNTHAVQTAFANQMMKGPNEFFTQGFTGKQVQDWYAYQKTTNVFHDDYLETAGSLTYYWYSLGPVALGMSTYLPLSEEQIVLFQHFRNVFGLAYRRYLDIEKAEAQAREAQIEVALERVRSRSLAMHHSDELSEVMSVMFQKLTELHVLLGTIAIQIFDTKTKDCVFWVGNDKQEPAMVKLPYDEKIIHEDGYMKDCWNAKEKGESFFNRVYSFEQKNKYFNYVFANNDTGVIPAAAREFIMQAKSHINCLIIEKHSSLFADSWEQQFYSDEKIEVLKRVARVFDQAYVRFLDLQKAEAQARESEIQLALERVRARTMAMYKSEELADVSLLLFNQVEQLGIKTWATGFNIWLEGDESYIDWVVNGATGKFMKPYTVHLTGHPLFREIGKARKRGDEFFVIEEGGKSLEDHYRVLGEMAKTQLEDVLDSGFQLPEHQVNHFVFGQQVSLMFITHQQCPEAHDIFKRFGKVFEQTYTRFLDLQKAEAQAREAQIEASLERVRSTSLAMHTSQDLSKVVYVVFTELVKLDALLDRCVILIVNPETLSITWYLTGKEGLLSNNGFLVEDNPHPSHQAYLEGWKTKRKKWHYLLAGKEKKSCDAYLFSQTQLARLPDFIKADMAAVESIHLTISSDDFGCLIASSISPLSVAHSGIVDRFTSVFNQTYTRFLDLQKAEAQARESQVDLALERVRARTMAMQHSDELMDAANLLFQQVQSLGIPVWTCGYNIWEIGEKVCTGWMSTNGSIQPSFRIPLTESPTFIHINESRLKGEPFFVEEVSGEALAAHYRYMFSLPDFKEIAGEQIKEGFVLPSSQIHNVFNFRHGNLIFISSQPVPESWDIFKRFAKVFEQTYTRFLDLQRAEAQAREAQIEVALEKVRSTSLAMHKAEELKNVVAVVFQKLKELGLTFDVSGIQLFTERSKDIVQWVAAPDLVAAPILAYLPFVEKDLLESEILKDFWEAREMGKSFFNKKYSFVEKNKFFEYAGRYNDFNAIPEDVREFQLKAPVYMLTLVAEKRSALWVDSYSGQTIPGEGFDILKRFARVFEQAYVRFLDLQKAEAQAREAQIEAALERVRSRTLAMHNSDELAETAAVVFKQLIGLGIAPNRLYIGIIKDLSGEQIELWATDEDGSKVSTQFTGNINRNRSIKTMYEGWKTQQKSITIDMQGKELAEYFHYLGEELKVPFQLGFAQTRRVQTLAYFSQGFIGMASPDPQPEETTRVLERFAYVFNLTYTRFNDLQHAEEQTRKAQIEVALERVRARALAMQTSGELIEVAHAMREQMGLLGQPDMETAAVHLYTKDSPRFESWYAFRPGRQSTGEIITGSAIFGVNSCELVQEFMALHFSGANEYTLEANESKQMEWNAVLAEAIPSITEAFYQEFTDPLPKTYFHFSDFSGGSLVMVTYQPPSQEAINLQRRAASVFDLAYRRFLDLQHKEDQAIKLVQEKERLEFTLKELKATQSQLIQSEKMASLGELTAGIAHEIQNPLNFVNNFSDLNTELVDELKEELKTGNFEEAGYIADDIKTNNEKINHHGKRAESIVTGMLQHSRTSTGQKEPTDINNLADEYLRLAYHGIRAKNKDFNCEIITEFDTSIGKINIIPQDIGRVILNLVNNAFYAVNERLRQAQPDSLYKPAVCISTRKQKGSLMIIVTDNGNGIPQKVVDKIFQPFFTTKPTGQGTGLGLSLSYDIVKAHGGEIKVETKVGEGAEFIITLPQ